MTTIKRIANHTGLDVDRIEDILSSIDMEPENLSIDEARIEVIKALRSGASGTIQKEEVESETARLTQARRIKIEVQTKNLRVGMRKEAAFSGYLSDDSKTQAGRSAQARYTGAMNSLEDFMIQMREASERPAPAPVVPEIEVEPENRRPPAQASRQAEETHTTEQATRQKAIIIF